MATRGNFKKGLLDLGFLELDMLAHNGIIFAERQLFSLRARIFLGDIEKASVRRAGELAGSWRRFDRGNRIAGKPRSR